MGAIGWGSHLIVAAAMLCSLGACSTGGEESPASPNGTAAPTGGGSTGQGRTGQGGTGQGRGSGADLGALQEGAESAAGQIASGDGLRVENRTGRSVALVFPDGNTGWVAAGRHLTILTPCRDRLPLRAESASGDLIAERSGPCRRRDTWTLD